MTRAPDPAALSEFGLFQGLSSDQLSKLAPLLHESTFPAGTEVITAEEPGEGAYVILSGTVKVYVTHTDGTEIILAILGPGEIVGEMSLADSLGRSASVLTLEDTTFLWMDRSTFLSSMEEMPAIARNIVGILSRRLRLADTHTRSLAALDVHGRVAAQFLAFAREYGEPLPEGDTLASDSVISPTSVPECHVPPRRDTKRHGDTSRIHERLPRRVISLMSKREGPSERRSFRSPMCFLQSIDRAISYGLSAPIDLGTASDDLRPGYPTLSPSSG